VNAVCKDGQGYIWAATDPGGISRFDYSAQPGKEFSTLNNENGLPSNLVYSVLTDDSGNVWAGTAKGLAWVNTRTLQVRSFGKKDGMVTDFLDLPLSLAANGEVLSGTVYGVQFFHPDSVLKESVVPEILLTAFKIFDKNYADSLNINFLKIKSRPTGTTFLSLISRNDRGVRLFCLRSYTINTCELIKNKTFS
jgi:hypothetical protein